MYKNLEWAVQEIKAYFPLADDFEGFMGAFIKRYLLQNSIEDAGILEMTQKYFPYSNSTQQKHCRDIENIFDRLDCWEKDDMLCWVYQYYGNDTRNMSKSKLKNKAQKKELIHAKIYTPMWIVDYLTGGAFAYYGLKEMTAAEIKKIRILDPACGSGNFLIRIYDYLMQLYSDKGVERKQACKFILEKNIFGCDIDSYSVKIAKIILACKAYKDGADKPLKINLSCFDEKSISPETAAQYRTLGSLYPAADSKLLKEKSFDIILSNPPYTDSSDYSAELKTKIDIYYKDYRKNLYACFIIRSYSLLKKNGICAMITPQTFMFISSFKQTRSFILDNMNIKEFAHFGLGGVFENALVDTCAFILKKEKHLPSKARYIKLDGTASCDKKAKLYGVLEGKYPELCYYSDQNDFESIPGKPFVYWISQEFRDIFSNPKLMEFADVRQGIATGNNKRFLRYFWEVEKNSIRFDNSDTSKKWVPYAKGGPYNKWYGNLWWVIAFDSQNKDALQNMGNNLPNKEYYFRSGITYSMTTSSGSTFRYLPKGFVFDCKGSSVFCHDDSHTFRFLALLNSRLAFFIYGFIAGSVDLEVGDLRNLPIHRDLLGENKLAQKLDRATRLLTAMRMKKEAYKATDMNYKLSEIHQVIGSGAGFDMDIIGKTLEKRDFLDLFISVLEGMIEETVFHIYGISQNGIKEIIFHEGSPLCFVPVFSSHLKEFDSLCLKYININEYKTVLINEDDIGKVIKDVTDYIQTFERTERKPQEKAVISSYCLNSGYEYDNPFERIQKETQVNPLDSFFLLHNNRKPVQDILTCPRTKEMIFWFLDHEIRSVISQTGSGFIALLNETGKNTSLINILESRFKVYKLKKDALESCLNQRLEDYLITEYIRCHIKMYKNVPVVFQIGSKDIGDCIFIDFKNLEKSTPRTIISSFVKPLLNRLQYAEKIKKRSMYEKNLTALELLLKDCEKNSVFNLEKENIQSFVDIAQKHKLFFGL
ncbi:MAG TPA: N-6 DNA methylase [Petrotogaceae bacterium]|jgi:SAM-dependent methyltransferase|nr:N-6 DNA methylase [Petrotogaceae bacterium]HQH33011.1 N-6 DNA methylase [Petrotogaceae bacterium]HQI77994.1 N-6 DNA methylase [Petrotogaceae bacterium]